MIPLAGLSAKDCSAFSSVSISYVDISFANSLECRGDDDHDDAENDEKYLFVWSVPAGRKVVCLFIVLVIGELLKEGDCVKEEALEATRAAVSDGSGENRGRVMLLLLLLLLVLLNNMFIIEDRRCCRGIAV